MEGITSKILLTGGSGFIGRNILDDLRVSGVVDAPSRGELDLRDTLAVEHYLEMNRYDVVIHGANPNPVKNKADGPDSMLQDSLRIFANLLRCSNLFGKMLYFGSGAEYDKIKPIVSVVEEDIGQSIPRDSYGFGKYIMNELARASKNIYNLRIFACYGPTDHESKFITHVLDCISRQQPITIRQNVYFDYMHVSDLVPVLRWFIDRNQLFKDYNICTGERMDLLSIATITKKLSGSSMPITVLKDGFNNEYTADNSRLLAEMGSMTFLPIRAGIARQIAWQREHDQ